MLLLQIIRKNKAVAALVLAALLLLGNVLPMPASADDEEPRSSSEIQEQLDKMEEQNAEIEAEIAELESQLQDNLTEMEAIVAQKNLIDREVFLLHKQVRHINEMISAYNVLIADKQAELNKAQERLETLNKQNKERIRAMEEDGKLSYWAVLFKANSFSDLLDRIEMIAEIEEADQRRMAELKQAAEKVALAQAELTAEKANLEATQEELAVTETELKAKGVVANELLADLIATGEEFEKYLEESEMRQEALLEEMNKTEIELNEALESEAYSRWLEESYSIWLEESIAESIWLEESWLEESRRQEEEANRPTYEPPGGGSGGGGSGGWRSPLTESSWVTSPYGYRLHPIYGDWRMHHGVDLASYEWQDIVAAKSGRITECGWDPWGGGNYIRIDHGDGYSSAYLHMVAFGEYDVGDYVYAGDLIGYVGTTGGSTGPHLHFAIYYYGSSVNPCDYVSFY